MKPGRLPRHVPSVAKGPREPQANQQPPRGCPSPGLTGALPCWLSFLTVPLVNLHLNWPCTGPVFVEEDASRRLQRDAPWRMLERQTDALEAE
ncbi:hypothetical protein EYF80_017047 [Liparis tanakae]|uniref:Uncharacterized protein n=1 Tax=Liparis tanakae TaxID=230148 RepID=A0A4Z2I6A5_9TELE|nr:hypothetical protein EYF80_017047 [Liparis tanakae]